MKYGFIGTGNMGGALLKGYLTGGTGKSDQVYAFDLDEFKLGGFKREFGINACASVKELVSKSDAVVLGVKPNAFEEILPQVAEAFSPSKLIISMAAGISLGFIENYLGSYARVIRIMPNTPAMVGEAMVGVCRNDNVNDMIFGEVFNMISGLGRAAEVNEGLIDCVVGVSGSSPAYTYMYIEALANAAIKNGMEEKKAILFAAQAVLGAAKMVLENPEISPEQLRINVCSPGGTTIEAVKKLQENGFEKNIEEAFQAAVDKSKLMTK